MTHVSGQLGSGTSIPKLKVPAAPKHTVTVAASTSSVTPTLTGVSHGGA